RSFRLRSAGPRRIAVQDAVRFENVGDQDRRQVQVAGRASLRLNIFIDETSLALLDTEYACQIGRRHLVVVCPERQVHLAMRQSKVKLILPLDQAVSVRRGNGLADPLRQTEVRSERINLGLVEMRDGFDVRRAVAILHEESLIVLESVWRTDDSV